MERGEPLLVDGGDFLGRGLSGDRERAELIFGAMEKMGYRVATLGESELNFGWNFIQPLAAEHHLTFVSANVFDLKTGKPLVQPYVLEEVAGLRVGIFGLLGNQIVLKPPEGEEAPEVRSALEAAQTIVPELRGRCDAVVALLHLGPTEAADLLQKVPGIDLAVFGHDPGLANTVEFAEGSTTYVVKAADRGQRVALVNLSRGTERPVDVSAEVVLLSDNVPQDADLAALLDREDKKIKEEVQLETARLTIKREMDRGDDHYLGDATCRKCHENVFQQWQTTAHARAFGSLETMSQDGEASCLACHVTGYGHPSGFVGAHSSPDLRGVQCESCHGMGTQHGPGYAQAARATCGTCHTAGMPAGHPGSWRGNVSFKSSWRGIRHPPATAYARPTGATG